jgi:hypothetical protein
LRMTQPPHPALRQRNQKVKARRSRRESLANWAKEESLESQSQSALLQSW